jgi:P27 family predicted phage terminase small subunit
MRGRKKTPLPAEPSARKLPRPPPELSADAVTEWRRVGRLQRGILTELDRGVLTAYCQAYARWAQAERAVREMAARQPLYGGLMIATKNGNVIQNPLVGIANKALSDLARYAAELGMTPSGRARVAAGPGEVRLGKKEETHQHALTAEKGSHWDGLLN